MATSEIKKRETTNTNDYAKKNEERFSTKPVKTTRSSKATNLILVFSDQLPVINIFLTSLAFIYVINLI